MMFYLVLSFSLFLTVFGTLDDEIQRTALENPDLFGGDIAGIDDPLDIEKNAFRGRKFRWPNATVPYIIDDGLSSENAKALIMKAIQHYHDKTCVRFVPRTNEKDYVRFWRGQGCYSSIGKRGGQQSISLGHGCMYVGTIIHEIGHTLGFYHEQNRSDRDKYLIIYFNNIDRSLKHNFVKLPRKINLLLTPFDYGSIMIYGNKAFSKDGVSNTMEARNGRPLFYPFTKKVMTPSDIQRVKLLYNC